MKNSNLFKILVCLHKDEKSTFIKWLEFRDKTKLLDSFKTIDLLIKEHGQSLSKALTFEHLYPGRPYNDHLLRVHLHRILKEIKKFIAYQEFESNSIEEERNWLKWLRKRNLEDLSKHYFNKYLKTVKDNGTINWIGNTAHYDIVFEDIFCRETFQDLTNKDAFFIYQKVEEYLIINVLCWHFIITLLNGLNLEEKITFSIGENVKKLVRQPNFRRTNMMELLSLASMVMMKGSSNHTFESYYDLLRKTHQNLDDNLCNILYGVALAYATARNNTFSSEESLNLLFTLIKEKVRLGYMLVFGILPFIEYLTVVQIALEAGDFEFANSFNEEFKPFVSVTYRNSSNLLNRGKIRYYEGEVSDALIIFNEVVLKDENMYMTLCKYRVYCYYELNENRALSSLIISALRRSYRINKNNQSNLPILSWKSFLSYVKKLMTLRYNYNVNKQTELIDSIKNESEMIGRKWLLREARKLK